MLKYLACCGLLALLTAANAESSNRKTEWFCIDSWVRIARYPVGRQPKQVAFTPDSRRLIVSLLDGSGFDLVDLEAGGRILRTLGPNYRARGFVEILVCPERGSLWISQMTTSEVHEYSLPGYGTALPHHLRSLPTRGSWSKVMAVDKGYRWLAVSNWLSNTVTILDYYSGERTATLAGIPVPRGLAFSTDGSSLYVTSYEGSAVYRYTTADWKKAATREIPGSAMRHLALSPDGKTVYASDMHGGAIYRLDAQTLQPLGSFKTDPNPNTIALSPDGKRLFVSCRGPNNPESYLLRSPVNGRVFIFDTATGDTEAILPGGNQPTGLAVSPDGHFLAFTNFLDDNVELWRIPPARP